MGFVANSGWVMELGSIHVWVCLECVPVSELGLGLVGSGFVLVHLCVFVCVRPG